MKKGTRKFIFNHGQSFVFILKVNNATACCPTSPWQWNVVQTVPRKSQQGHRYSSLNSRTKSANSTSIQTIMNFRTEYALRTGHRIRIPQSITNADFVKNTFHGSSAECYLSYISINNRQCIQCELFEIDKKVNNISFRLTKQEPMYNYKRNTRCLCLYFFLLPRID